MLGYLNEDACGKGRARWRGLRTLPSANGVALGAEQPAAVGESLIHDLATRARTVGRRAPIAAAQASVDLDAVERIFTSRLDAVGTQPELARCRERAAQLAAANGERTTVALAYASDLLVICAVERPWQPHAAGRVVSKLGALLGLARETVALQLFLGAVRAPQLLDLPPAVALETQLRLLVAVAPLVEASLWMKEATGRPRCLIAAGETTETRRFRAVAVRALQGAPADSGTRGTIVGAPVMRWETPWAALVVRTTRVENRKTIAAYVLETVAAMSPVIEREVVLQRSAAREQSLVRASERRLGRLAFDLHDTALQHIAALGADFYLFRRQLTEGLSGSNLSIAASRVQDFEARAWELDRVLRELAHSLEPSSLVRRPLERVINDEATAFTERTGIEVRQRVHGDFSGITASQKIALIRIVQEALTNIREHANASVVRISITARNGRIDARIEDDGSGFHVARTLIECAKRGRFGLVGSSERVRLLGGKFDVSSRPGGPTSVSLSLPRWQPLTAAQQPAGDAAVALLAAE
jgi:signal transduction histidine kinase